MRNPAFRSSWLAPLLVLATVTLVMALEAWLIAYKNGGLFLYTTDDAYIHLSMSEQIARGGYGVNPGEFAAAASSILFPVLLAPFAGFSWQSWTPLAFSYLAVLGSGLLLLKIFDRGSGQGVRDAISRRGPGPGAAVGLQRHRRGLHRA
jgi:hypothetical protein